VAEVKYVAEARRVGSWWAIDVIGVPGAHTQARRLDQVENVAKDIVAILTDEAPRSITIEVRPVLDKSLGSIVARTRKLRQDQTELEKRARAETKVTTAKLVANGFSTRDVGRLLGFSHQRVGQILPPKKPVGGSAPSANQKVAAKGRGMR